MNGEKNQSPQNLHSFFSEKDKQWPLLQRPRKPFMLLKLQNCSLRKQGLAHHSDVKNRDTSARTTTRL